MFLALGSGYLHFPFMIEFLLLYSIYEATLTVTAFYQRIYTQNLKITHADTIKAIFICLLENLFFHYILAFVRTTAVIGYKKNISKAQLNALKKLIFSKTRQSILNTLSSFYY